MGKIQFSALVTSITGSIGGTTFRRTPRGAIAYNKQARLITNAITSNNQRLAIGAIMSSWGKVPQEEKDMWKSIAEQVPFVDKFGKTVYLSSRQLYIKCNSQALVDNTVNPDPFDFVAEVPSPIINDVYSSVNDDETTVYLSEELTATRVTVAVKPRIKPGSVKPHAHFKVGQALTVNGTNEINITNLVKSQPAGLREGAVYEVHIYAINKSGLTSPVTAWNFTVGA
jgi:hypothetical protein